MRKRVLVVLGHPSGESFCGALTECYVGLQQYAGPGAELTNHGA